MGWCVCVRVCACVRACARVCGGCTHLVRLAVVCDVPRCPQSLRAHASKPVRLARAPMRGMNGAVPCAVRALHVRERREALVADLLPQRLR